MKTGLLLGAGFSYEAGMPLVSELTDTVRWVFRPEQLSRMNELSRPFGTAIPDPVLAHFSRLLATRNMNYETIIGALEVSARRHENRELALGIHGLTSHITSLLYQILRMHHKAVGHAPGGAFRYIHGLSTFVDANHPLWVFSLNHDLIVESLAAEADLPLNSGFPDEAVIPLPKGSITELRQLKVALLPRRNAEKELSCIPDTKSGYKSDEASRIP